MPLEDILTGHGGQTFPLPKCAGAYCGRAVVVCGDAACIWDDLERFGCRSNVGRGRVAKPGWDFLTVNKLVETFPGDVEHAYSNEAHLLAAFVAARRFEYRHEFEGPKHLHSCSPLSREYNVTRWPWSGRGTSALGAILIGLGLGYERIVLAGIPLDSSPHNGEPSWRKCRFDKEHPEAVDETWKQAMKQAFNGRVTSLSGRTRDWLGGPS